MGAVGFTAFPRAQSLMLTSTSWHETQAIYACDFQPLPVSQLKRLLPSTIEEEDRTERPTVAAPPRQYRFATCGGDFKVRVSTFPPDART